MITPTDLGWTAGFIEGEGSFLDTKMPRISVEQVQKEPLEKLVKLYGGSIYLRKRKYKDSRKDIWIWVLVGSSAAGLMMTLYGLMSSKRKEQIRKVLDLWRKRGVAPHLMPRCKYGHEWSGRWATGRRYCKICDKRRYLKWYLPKYAKNL